MDRTQGIRERASYIVVSKIWKCVSILVRSLVVFETDLLKNDGEIAEQIKFLYLPPCIYQLLHLN